MPPTTGDYSRLLALICVLLPVGARPAIAQNITPTTNNGTGTVINNQGQRFDITGGQRSGNGANLFHSFQQFNLDAGQTANFISAPNIQNILGRVTGGNASIINGLIQVTGGQSNLILMNPAGVLFGPSARLDVPASFSVTTATGIGFGNNWFNAIGSNDYQNLVGTPNRYRFEVSQPGAIVNSGQLEVPAGQDLTLTGGTVINTGSLSTPGGNVTIAAVEGGDTVRISQEGHLLNLEISNRRTGVSPVSGQQITPLSLPGLLTEGNANSHATGLTVDEQGQVVLTAGSRNPVSQRNRVSSVGGTAITSGTIDTSSSNIGGEVNVLGQRVGVLNANINADGINGGGSVFIGGDFQGNNRLPASEQTVINNNSFISANALESGDGGQTIIWSDGTTRFEGNISATGGANFGDGGLVEVSGKRQLLVNGFIDVSAENGAAGTILFDPENITVDELAADDVTDETDGELEGEQDGLAADVVTDETDGELEGEQDGLAADFVTDLTDGLSEGEQDGLAADFVTDLTDGLSEGESTGTTSERGERGEIETRAPVDPFAPDADYNVTISAENIENLEGNVTLQADNDITVNQEINTSESVELKAGRSININADIDTSSGNGNISLFGNDNNANAANRSRGAANINQLENTTLNAGSGNITLRLGNLGRVGDINVENLTTTGRVLINANGGNIGRVSPNSLITAGNLTFRTSDAGSVGLTNAPLRLDVDNVEAEVGTGGAFLNAISDVNIGGTNPNLNGILSEGEIDLSAVGDVTVSERIRASGNLSLAASDSINVNANLNSSPGNGNIALRANDEGVGAASRRGRASISQAEGTNINAGSGNIAIEFGSLGNSRDISLANLTTTGTARVSASAGNILRVGENSTINAGSASFETAGEGGIGSAELPMQLDVQNLEAVAGSGGAFFDAAKGITVGGVRDELTGIVTTDGGDIELSAEGRVVVSEGILANGGGDIGLSAGGNLTVSQEISTTDGGDIGLSAGRNLTVEADISTSVNSGDAGNITLDSGGTVKMATATVSSTATEGAGGDVTLEAVGDIETGSIDSGGGASSGAIDLTSSEGGINTTGGSLTSGSDGAAVGGNVALTAVGDIETGDINSPGSTTSGSINITSSEGGINTTGGSLSTGGDGAAAGGDATLTAVGDIETGSINSPGSTTSGSINITSSEGGINTSDLNSSSSAGSAGNVELQAENNIVTTINASGSQQGGNINLTSNAGDVFAPNLDVTSANGSEGTITINANAGNIEVGSINLTIEEGGSDNPFSEENSTENARADADTVNDQTGEVSLQAHNDITINEAIESAEISTLELTAGRNININADIDTSAGNGNIRLEANNQSANPDLRETGQGNVNMTAGTTLSAGSGQITIKLGTGEIGEVGSINLANLATTEALTVDASGGDILRVGENSIINAGEAIFLTSGSGSIGSQQTPLRLDAANLEAIGGSGGAFFDLLSGVTVGGVRDELTGIITEGGDVELKVAGDLTVTEDISTSATSADGGNITLDSGGTIEITKATLTSGGNSTTGGGDVSLTAVGDIETGDIYSNGSTSGGAISITSSEGGINTRGALHSRDEGTAVGGDVSLTAVGDIETGDIRAFASTSGGAISITSSEGGINTRGRLISGRRSEVEVGGDVTLTAVGDINVFGRVLAQGTSAGAISITSTEGGINTTGGRLSSGGNSRARTEVGVGGDVTLTAVGDIKTGAIDSDGSTSSGTISITSSEGGINTTEGTLISSGNSGGDVNLTAVGDVSADSILSYGSTSGGAISITSSEGGINTSGDLNSSSSAGSAGNVELQAENSIATTNINANGSQQGGNITITSNAGDVFAPNLDATSANGSEGTITINANTGSIEVGTINLTIEEGGSDNPFSEENSTENSTADADTVNDQTGEVSLQAHNDITINEAIESAEISSLELTAGRNININADIDTSAGNGNIALEANSQTANPDLRETGPGNVNMAAGTTLNAGSGEITITLGFGEIGEVGNINLANLTTTGAVTVDASGGDILRVGENSIINAGTAAFSTSGSGSISSQQTPLRLDAANLEAVAGSGEVFFDVLGEVTVGGASGELRGIITEGGDVELKVAGDLTATEDISTLVASGDGGNINLESGGAINTTAARLDSHSSSEAGGDVTLTAVGDINTGDILSSGVTSGGTVSITSSGGGINFTRNAANAAAPSGAGGDVTLTAAGDINTGRILSWGSISGGAISITSTEGGINLQNLVRSGFFDTEVGGDVTLTAVGDINTVSIDSSGITLGGAINITSTEGSINAFGGDLNSYATGTESSGGTAGNVTLEAARLIRTGNINAAGSKQGGNITIESQFGDVDTSGGQLAVDSANGRDGNIDIQAFTGSVSVGDIDGTRNLTVAPGGEDDPLAENTSNSEGSSITSDADKINSRSGEVTLQAHNDVTINEAIEASEISNLEIRAGRNIDINADIDTSGGNGNITLQANDGGANPDYRLPGRGSATMAPGTTLNAGSGDISVILGNFGGDPANVGNITLGNLTTTGAVTVGAGTGNIFRASPNSLVTAGSAFFQTFGSGGIGSPRERLRVRVDSLEAAAGSGGAFFNSPTQGLTITGITTIAGGDVGVRANGDITVTAPISTATNSTDAGNITLKADNGGNIDTSAASLDASASHEDNGGTVALEGDGNITTATIDTGTRFDILRNRDSRGRGRGGDILLNAGGNIDTTAGRIDSSTRSIGDAGNITFIGEGNITTGNVYSSALSWGTGTAGNITLESRRGNIDTRGGSIQSSSNRGNGGDVELITRGNGDISTGNVSSTVLRSAGNNGGSIILNSGGNIDTTAGFLESSTGSDTGSADNISLNASGDIDTGDIRTFASGSGPGGNVTIEAGGNVDATGGNILSASVEGNTGEIDITAGGDVRTGGIDLASGFRVEVTEDPGTGEEITVVTEVLPVSGVAGDINITSTNGTIDTSARVLDSRSPDGSGNITLNAPGNITTGAINASALNDAQPTQGGDINITSSEGDINAGIIETFSEIGTAGNVALDAAGTVNTRDILSDGDQRGGNIAITSDSQNTINVRGSLETFSTAGTGGDVTLTAVGSVNTRDITTFGNTRSGNITITSQNNNVTTGAITTQAPGGDSGNIRVNGENVATGNLRSIARDSAGGIRVQATDGSIDTEDIEVTAEEGTAGPVELEATEDVETGDIEVTAGEGDAEINIEAGGDITGGDQTATAEAGDASINNEAGGDINLRDQLARAEGGNASINNEAGGDINLRDQIATAEGGNASINNEAGGDITAGDQTAVAEGGDASINNEAGGNITAGDQTAISFGGDASINNEAVGNITVGDQTALSEGGNAFINNDAGGNLTTGDQTAVAPDGINQVTNNAGGTINTGELTEGGNDITPFLNNNPVLLVENDVAPVVTSPAPSVPTPVLTAPAVQTPAVTTPAPAVPTPVLTAPAVQTPVLTAPAPSVQTPAVTTPAPPVQIPVVTTPAPPVQIPVVTTPTPSVQTPVVTTPAPSVQIPVVTTPAPSVQTPAVTTPAPSVQTPVVTPAPSVQTPVLTTPAPTVTTPVLTTPAPAVQTPVVTPAPSVQTPVVTTSPSEFSSNNSLSNNPSIQNAVTAANSPQSSNSSGSITNVTGDTQQILDTLNVINTNPMTIAANSDTLTRLEQSRNQEFEDYLGLDSSEDVSAIKNVRAVLKDIEKQTGNRSAVVYINVYPEQLQLILFTPDGEPSYTIISIPQEQLMETVREYQEYMIRRVYRHTNEYLPAAQQLYQWLIAPIASELEAAKIDTLLFSMDSGLRGLPIAALHDGERFLIENYSLSFIPSLSLIDTRYLSVENSPLMAMGASVFPAQQPLPAVPVELETITQDSREGEAFLNEEFTRENLINQRENYPYPIIHLATHANFQSGDASNSYIELWNGDKLRLNQMRELGWHNPAVELLVLSACRTALGDADAELGFAGLAVAAGVKSAVASLWYVSDEGTLGLMTEFYTHLSDVTIKAEALREAQLAMLRGDVRIEEGQLRGSTVRGGISLPLELAVMNNVNLSHPYYWSGFTMIGSPW